MNSKSFFAEIGFCLTLILSHSVGFGQTECADFASDIIAWWAFDDTSSTTAIDIIGNNQGVLVNGPTYVEGVVGNTLRFDGQNDYVGVPDNDLWAFGSNDFTIELWANWDAPGGGSVGHPGDVFVSHDEGPGTRRKWFFALGGGVLNFHINGAGAGSGFFPRVPFSPVVGQWYHLAVTRQGNTFTIYLNGVPSGSATSSVVIPNPDAPLLIGQSNEPFGGFMNGRLDEVTIYNRALSEEEIATIFTSGSIGKCKTISISTEVLSLARLGEPFSQEIKAILGQPPFTWSLIDGTLPSGMEFTSDGVLTGVPLEAGNFGFTVSVTDGRNENAQENFTLTVLATLPSADIRLHKAGTVAVPGREVDYFILVENIGNVTATGLEVVEILDLRHFSLLSTEPPAVDSLTLAEVSFVVWTIPELFPGESKVLSYQALLDPSTPLGTNVSGPACSGIDLGDRLAECLAKLGATTLECAACVPPCSAIGPGCGTILACWPTIAACATCILGVGPTGPGGCGPDAVDVFNCFKDIGEDCFSDDQPTVGPVDPNEIVVMPEKYIRRDQKLLYAIHYENIGQVEARDVFLTDVLDPNLDISTLEIISSEGASFDAGSRILKWELINRNLQPGETDNVLFSIRPLSGLPSGTEIRNQAEIQFEVFEVVPTNEVVNIIDEVPPVALMDSLPPEVTTLEFPISWSGQDSIGEVKSYTVFVSVDSSGFQPFIQRTSRTDTLFTGKPGRTYAFLCIAEDEAGNVEVQDPIAEAVTFVSEITSIEPNEGGLPTTYFLSQNYPNPFNPTTTIRFEVPKSSEVKIIVYDILGREVRTLVDRKLEAGKYSKVWNGRNNNNVSVASGVYFVRMQARDFVKVNKLLLIK